MSQEIMNGLLGHAEDDVVKEALEVREGVANAGLSLWQCHGHRPSFATIDIIAEARDRNGTVYTLDLPGNSIADRNSYPSDRTFVNLDQVTVAAEGLAARIEECLARISRGYKVWVTIRMAPNDGRPRDIVGKAYFDGDEALGEAKEQPYDPDVQ
jgi:hypothetical protein